MSAVTATKSRRLPPFKPFLRQAIREGRKCMTRRIMKPQPAYVCGYDGEHNELEAHGWQVVAWQGQGGYGNRTTKGQQNGARERIWFSPHCLQQYSEPMQSVLFGEGAA